MEHKGVAAVDRALAIIGAFEQRPEALTLAEIARGMSRPMLNFVE